MSQTQPMESNRRVAAYDQQGGEPLTPRQRRRLRRKFYAEVRRDVLTARAAKAVEETTS